MRDLQRIALATVPVVLGVLVAGYLMASFRHLPVIADAHAGFDS